MQLHTKKQCLLYIQFHDLAKLVTLLVTMGINCDLVEKLRNLVIRGMNGEIIGLQDFQEITGLIHQKYLTF